MVKRFEKVAVLMGGPSSEREISLQSGRAVSQGLEQAGYEVLPVVLDERTVPTLDGAEAVFIALHGAFGEDGGVQAILDERHIPYTGSGADSSCRSMDKVLSKKAFVQSGILTAPYEILRAGDTRTLPLPVVLKPVTEGSSIGLHRVVEEAAWDDCLADTLQYGGIALVEQYIEGRELTVGIVDGQALPPVEIRAPDAWYDYSAKYAGGSEYLVPAPLDEPQVVALQSVARDVFAALACRGFGRVDFRLHPDGRMFVLELNSIPGFTPNSLLPKAAGAAGIEFHELCHRIMQTAAYDG
ncbi:MAG: D-alanine--D-alanine ligase [Kiritimatiellae bacterium]|nr:D-alanine--D-alanine ligase [Kiritimatiellia bacterium]